MPANLPGGYLSNLFEDMSAPERDALAQIHSQNMQVLRQIRAQLASAGSLGIIGTIVGVVSSLLPFVGGLFSKPKGPYGDIEVAGRWQHEARAMLDNIIAAYNRESDRTRLLVQQADSIFSGILPKRETLPASPYRVTQSAGGTTAPAEVSTVSFSVGLLDYDKMSAGALARNRIPGGPIQDWGHIDPAPEGQTYLERTNFRTPAARQMEVWLYELRRENQALAEDLEKMKRFLIDDPQGDLPAGWEASNIADRAARTVQGTNDSIMRLRALADLFSDAAANSEGEQRDRLKIKAGEIRGKAILLGAKLAAFRRMATPGDLTILDGEMRKYQLRIRQALTSGRLSDIPELQAAVSHYQALMDWNAGSEAKPTVDNLANLPLSGAVLIPVIVGIVAISGAVAVAFASVAAMKILPKLIEWIGGLKSDADRDLERYCLDLVKEGKATPEFCRQYTKTKTPAATGALGMGLGIGALALLGLGLWAFSRR